MQLQFYALLVSILLTKKRNGKANLFRYTYVHVYMLREGEGNTQLTSKFVSRMGIRTMKITHSIIDAGRNGTSSVLSPPCWKMVSNSNSPVVMVIVLMMVRPGEENGVRTWSKQCNVLRRMIWSN